jgi:nucleoside-diphosphate-sugar epimerase
MITASVVLLLFPSWIFSQGGSAFSVAAPRRIRSSGQSRQTHLGASIAAGDTILVVGGTGGVGQLVTRKLQNRGDYTVRISSRNKERAQATIGSETVQVVEFDLISGTDEQLQAALKGVSAIVLSVGTTAFPTMKWAGGNTPEAIDKKAVQRMAEAASKLDTIKKIVLLTSIGVDRTGEMPFFILNLFGVLEAKKSGEEAVKAAAARHGKMVYAIVRPGRLIGGPFTNLDVARLLQIEGGAENGVDAVAGDVLLGDCKRDACAEAVVQCLVNDACRNVEFSIISNENKALDDQQWTEAFQNMLLL